MELFDSLATLVIDACALFALSAAIGLRDRAKGLERRVSKLEQEMREVVGKNDVARNPETLFSKTK